MKSLDRYRHALAFCTAAVMVAGCGSGSSTPLNPSPAELRVERTAARPAYKPLYSFEGGSRDGEWPVAGLVNVKGTLYGTTRFGGANGYGTVFSITRSGTEKVLYSFKNCPDGSYPYGGLLNVKGTLYGTTVEGGANCGTYGGFGTVFSITQSGMEKVLYSFKNDPDGVYPEADLLNINGILYGTTNQGGNYHKGTVFSITIHGKEKVLHSFGSSGDGVYPDLGALLNVKGTLYGTTVNGGAYSCGSIGYCGTIFSITTSGTETVLYSFKGPPDGALPVAGLVNVNGTLYGTTDSGDPNGYGTVFGVTTSGTEKLLHGFKGVNGAGPMAYSSASRARSMEPPTSEVRTTTERSSRSRHPARRRYSTVSRATLTAHTRWQDSSTLRARSTERPTTEARIAVSLKTAVQSSRYRRESARSSFPNSHTF